MNNKLDEAFAQWSKTILSDCMDIAEHEINNRMEPYPALASALDASPIDALRFQKLAQQTTLMTETAKYQSTSLNSFFKDERQARGHIRRLKRDLPNDPQALPNYLDAIIEQWGKMCGLQKNSVTLLISLILTCSDPQRFVDFAVQKWWVSFAQALGYGLPSPAGSRVTHGEWIAWSSAFARDIAGTPTFRESWQRTDQQRQYPMWVVAGLCWTNRRWQLEA